MVDVIDAKNSNKKNATDHRYPPGNCWNISGSIWNTSFGPAAGSISNENTAGNMMMPESIATSVSSNATTVALRTSGVLSEK